MAPTNQNGAIYQFIDCLKTLTWFLQNIHISSA